jgi:hypothetical protein
MKTLASLVLFAAVACGDSTAPHGVTGTAHVVHGPSVAGASMNLVRSMSPASFATGPTGGHWYISPDQGKINIVSLTFRDASGGVSAAALTNCTASYVRSAASLSSIVDCPFTVMSGTYVEVDIGISNTFQVQINDATHGIFTDPSAPTGLSTTAPAGGAGFVPLTIPTSGSANNVMMMQSAFDAPVVIDSTSPPTITLIVDMIHTVLMNVSGTTLTFDTSLPQPAVHVTPVIGGPGRVEFYTITGTANNVNAGIAKAGNEATSVRVVYNGAGTPIEVYSPVIGPSEAWDASPTAGAVSFTIGGYVGLDATRTLCWALPADFTYAQYAFLRSIVPPAAVGGTTVLKSKAVTTVPAPASGATYASGCPAFTPDQQTTLTLVAR